MAFYKWITGAVSKANSNNLQSDSEKILRALLSELLIVSPVMLLKGKDKLLINKMVH